MRAEHLAPVGTCADVVQVVPRRARRARQQLLVCAVARRQQRREARVRRGRRIVNQNIVLSLLIIAALPPLAITGVLGLAAVVLIHEVAEVLVILNGLRAARTHQPTRGH